jgi:hypothetical protein
VVDLRDAEGAVVEVLRERVVPRPPGIAILTLVLLDAQEAAFEEGREAGRVGDCGAREAEPGPNGPIDVATSRRGPHVEIGLRRQR